MKTSRSQTSHTGSSSKRAADSSVDATPELNVYEVHSELTVLTETGNTDRWIATDRTVTPPE